MRFWDTSTVLPLVVQQATTEAMRTILREDPSIIVWWGTEIECISGIARLEREGNLTPAQVNQSLTALQDLRASWHEIEPAEAIRDTARRLLRVHNLRTADALQLAAAIIASNNQPTAIDFVTMDRRLAEAAHREGFRIRGLTAETQRSQR